MWKKEDERRPPLPNNPQRTDPEPPAAGPHPPAERAASRASIGPSIEIRGELTGDEDLTIEGRVEGKIDLKEHGVTIGPQGQVRAEVHGRMIVVEGEVEGNLTAEEQILTLAVAIADNPADDEQRHDVSSKHRHVERRQRQFAVCKSQRQRRTVHLAVALT